MIMFSDFTQHTTWISYRNNIIRNIFYNNTSCANY